MSSTIESQSKAEQIEAIIHNSAHFPLVIMTKASVRSKINYEASVLKDFDKILRCLITSAVNSVS